jgi:two-component system OmpR family response regulator
MRHAGRVLSRQAILADVWGYDYDAGSDSNLVDVYVRYVRNKIAQPGEAPLIRTVRGEGYRFDIPTVDDANDALGHGVMAG